jgi:predicted aldo/keto reductase-like oxidoreductase
MERLQLDFLDFGMIHFVDEVEDFEGIMNGDFIEYVRKQKEDGVIKHIGISTHSPTVALLATEVEDIELTMFSINPAFDMMGAINNIEVYIE